MHNAEYISSNSSICQIHKAHIYQRKELGAQEKNP